MKPIRQCASCWPGRRATVRPSTEDNRGANRPADVRKLRRARAEEADRQSLRHAAREALPTFARQDATASRIAAIAAGRGKLRR